MLLKPKTMRDRGREASLARRLVVGEERALADRRPPSGRYGGLCRLLRNPSSVAALAIEHVKRSPCRRVEHVRDKLGLLAAF